MRPLPLGRHFPALDFWPGPLGRYLLALVFLARPKRVFRTLAIFCKFNISSLSTNFRTFHICNVSHISQRFAFCIFRSIVPHARVLNYEGRGSYLTNFSAGPPMARKAYTISYLYVTIFDGLRWRKYCKTNTHHSLSKS